MVFGPGGTDTASPQTIAATSFWVTPPSALTKPLASPNSKVRPAGTAVIAQTRWRRRPHDLQLPHEVNQVVLFLGSEFKFLDQVEELHRVFQCQKPAVVEIRWAVLDTPQRERLNRSISCFVFQELLDVEVVHLVIEIKGGRMAGGALRFAKEQFLARDFAGRGLRRVEPARDG